MKNMLKSEFVAAVALALAGTAAFPACALVRERPSEVVARMEVVEVDDRGYVRYQGEIVKPGEFAEMVRARQDALRGRRALIYADPAVYENQPEIMPYVIGVFEKAGAECAVDKTGK